MKNPMLQTTEIIHCSEYTKIIYELVLYINSTGKYPHGEVYSVGIKDANYSDINLSVTGASVPSDDAYDIKINWFQFWDWKHNSNKFKGL